MNPVDRARAVGVTAAWTGGCSATVDLSRLAGPRNAVIADDIPAELPGRPPWDLAEPRIRAAVYSWALTEGTQFDIYRWVNLVDLARVWPLLDVPEGISHEWAMVLRAAGLMDPPDPRT